MPTVKEMREWLRGGRATPYGLSVGAQINVQVSDDSQPVDADTSDWRIVNATSGQYSISLDGKDALLQFGKWGGSRVSELAADSDGRSYLQWMLEQDFVAEILEIVRRNLVGVTVKAK